MSTGRRLRAAADEGSAPAAVLAWVGVTTTVLAGLGLLGVGVQAHARADTAADLAALAGADALAAFTGDPCAVASDVATRNGAALSDCAVEGWDVHVAVVVEAPPLPPAQAMARAGPEPDEQP